MTALLAPTDPWIRPNTLVHDWSAMPAAAAEWVAGQQVGPFVLQRPLGRGGMGLVWLAEQQQPFVREVAIKVMLDASQGPLAEAYFQVERQALARLSHRAIAQIHDAGRLPDGSLFFAMEYVPGEPLHLFLQHSQAGPVALARLLIEVCLGIHHAHQRGLIHRDIKPGNILVNEVDGVVQPKIIDFGIAIGTEAIHQPSSRTLRIAGTEAYMSPEQKRPGPEGIDARSDVYALGAVLAECLYQLAGLDLAPAQCTSTYWRGEIKDSLAPRRKDEGRARRLSTLPPELRAIALKAMAEAREQRYDSAAALAEDLRRWLAREPVLAMGGGRAYLFRCFLRRNALASAALAAVLLALLGGMVLALYGLEEARSGRNAAEAAQQLAEQRRQDAESLVQFMLGDLHDRLRSIGRLDLLDAVGQEALVYLAKEPSDSSEETAVRRAKAYRTIAGSQLPRNQYEEAEKSLLLAAEQLRPWAADSRNAETHSIASDVAFRLGRISLNHRNDLDTAEARWQEHLWHARQVIAHSTDSGDGERQLSNALLNLGALEIREGRHRWERALAFFEECIAIKQRLVDSGFDANRMELANAWSWKALVYSELGRSQDAWESQRNALETIGGFDAGVHGDASKLVFEAEIRFQTALQALDLGRPDLAQEQIDMALKLAQDRLQIDNSNVSASGRVARTALHAARIATDASARYAQWRPLIAECLGKEGCAGRPGSSALQELHAMDLALRWRSGAGDRPSIGEIEEILDGVLVLESPSIDLLLRACELAVLLGEEARLTETRREALHAALGRVPEGRRGSLRYLLLKSAVLRLTGRSGPALGELERAIAEQRTGELALLPGGPGQRP